MLFSEIGLAQHQLQNSVCCLGLAFNFVIVQCDVSGIGGGGVSRRVSAFGGDNSCWGAVALSAGLSCGGWGERGLVGCVQS